MMIVKMLEITGADDRDEICKPSEKVVVVRKSRILNLLC